jgi:hypothetical protein
MGENRVEVRGEVRHVLSGELRYFREWDSLITYLAEKVCERAQEGQGVVMQPEPFAADSS